MKIVLTVILVAVLAIGLLGLNNSSSGNNIDNVFAQGDEEMVERNETGLVNSTGTINATLAFAQEGFQTEDLVNETIDLGNDTKMMNATLPLSLEGNDTAKPMNALTN